MCPKSSSRPEGRLAAKIGRPTLKGILRFHLRPVVLLVQRNAKQVSLELTICVSVRVAIQSRRYRPTPDHPNSMREFLVRCRVESILGNGRPGEPPLEGYHHGPPG